MPIEIIQEHPDTPSELDYAELLRIAATLAGDVLMTYDDLAGSAGWPAGRYTARDTARAGSARISYHVDGADPGAGVVIHKESERMAEETTVRLSRTINAPRARVFQAWTDPEALAAWWWPENFATRADVDPQAGGHFRVWTTGLPPGQNMAVNGQFQVVASPEAVVASWAWDGEQGTTRLAVSYEDQGGQTGLQLVHSGFANTTERDTHLAGWNGCLDRLEAWLAARPA